MKQLRLFAVILLVVGLACAASQPAHATILIQIDKPTQTMTVTVDGKVAYRWHVSTGATGFSTPPGTYKPFRMEAMHYSQGVGQCRHAQLDLLHLARPRHAWIRPSRPRHAGVAWLRAPLADQRRHALSLVGGRGIGDTTVIIKGPDPAGYFAATQIPKRQPAPSAAPFQWLFGGFGRSR